MSTFLFTLFSGAQGDGTANPTMMIITMVVFMAAMYFLTIRPQRKKEKEEQEMRSNLEIGDEVITNGGIVGRVVTIREEDVVIETGADRTKIKVQRWAIGYNKTKSEQHQREVEAAKAAAKEKKNKKKSDNEE